MIEFDPVNNLLRVSLSGDLNDQLLHSQYVSLGEHSAAHPGCRVIVDFTQVGNFAVSNEMVRRLAYMAPAFASDNPVVIVAPQELIFGLARMFFSIGSETRPGRVVVRFMDEALCYLEVSNPQFATLVDA